jgi:ABC-type transporter Mla subunit MlaD
MPETVKKKEPVDPRTLRDALAAQVMGDIDTLLDKLEATTTAINGSADKILNTIHHLEQAGETYNCRGPIT